MSYLEGEILAAIDVDDALALQIWRDGKAPWLVIDNRGRKKKKMIRTSWLENVSRKLRIRGARNEVRTYEVNELEPRIVQLMSMAVNTVNFKTLLWKSTMYLLNLIHTPKMIVRREDFALLSEQKRQSLWLADLTKGADDAAWLPCFPTEEIETRLFPFRKEEVFIPIKKGETAVDLRGKGIIRDLVITDSSRWFRPVQIAAAGILLGFSIGMDRAEVLADALWRAMSQGDLQNKAFVLANEPQTMAREHARRLSFLIRHWMTLRELSYEEHYDSLQSLRDREFERKRRLTMQPGSIGECAYTVTVYENESEGKCALGCHSQSMVSASSNDMIFTLPVEAFEQAMEDDRCHSSPDESFTIMSLILAKEEQMRLKRIESLLGEGLPTLA